MSRSPSPHTHPWARLRSAVALALVLLLSACAARDQLPVATGEWQAQRAQLVALTAWSLEGKVALRWPQGAESARLTWQQREPTANDAPSSDLRLYGPLGAGAIRIEQFAAGLRVTDRDGVRFYAAGEYPDLGAITGWPLPVDALPWWLRGLPQPDQAVTEMRFSAGLPSRLQQAGWTVSYDSFSNDTGLLLPRRIDLSYPAESVSVRLVGARWELGASDVP